MNATATKPEIFTVWSDEIIAQKRGDPEYFKPFYQFLIERIQKSKFVSKRLADITSLIANGKTPPKETYGNDNAVGLTPIIKVATASGAFVDLENVSHARMQFPKTLAVQKGDIFILSSAHQAKYVGKNVSFLDRDPKEMTFFVGELICIRADSRIVLPEYLFGVLSSDFGYYLLNREKRGQTSHLYPENIGDILIPIPSLDEQAKFIKILMSAYAEKRKKEEEIKKILASIDDFVLGELGIKLPEGGAEQVYEIWSDEVVGGRLDPFYFKPYFQSLLNQIKQKRHFSLGEAILDISGGATPTVTGNYYTEEENGVPFLRVQNITEEGIKLDDVKFIKREVHETMLKRSQLKTNDLVFTITGRIGSVAVVPKEFEGNINQHSVRFQLLDNVQNVKIAPKYVATFFNTKVGRDLSFRATTGGTRPALDYDALRTLIVPLPDYNKQNEIIAGVELSYSKMRTLRAQAAEVLAEAQKQVEQMILS